jgi:hypothetical protein
MRPPQIFRMVLLCSRGVVPLSAGADAERADAPVRHTGQNAIPPPAISTAPPTTAAPAAATAIAVWTGTLFLRPEASTGDWFAQNKVGCVPVLPVEIWVLTISLRGTLPHPPESLESSS